MARIKYEKDKRNNVLDKQAESKKLSKVYSTERITQILKDIKLGKSPDLDPFWHGDPKYRDTGIIFEYTQEELDILDKCAFDNKFFVENYCTFKNDKGRTLVKLRPYQDKVLKLFGDEVWDPVSETIIPKNRFIAIMQSRQTGKCVTLDTSIQVSEDNIDLFNSIDLNASKYSIFTFIFNKFKKLFS